MLLGYNGTAWSAVQGDAPQLADSGAMDLMGTQCDEVLCQSRMLYDGEDYAQHEVIWTYQAGQWSVDTTMRVGAIPTSSGRVDPAAHPGPAGVSTDNWSVNTTSCQSGTCASEGSYWDGTTSHVLLWVSDGHGWTLTKASMPAGASSSPAIVEDLRCGTGKLCVATGLYLDTNGVAQVALWSRYANSWKVTRTVLPNRR